MSRPRPRWLLLSSVCLAFGLAGCGDSGQGSSTAGSEKLERLIKVETARDLFTDTGVPRPSADDPRVRSASDEIDASCGETGAQRYECEIGIGDQTQVCAIGTDPNVTDMRWTRCGAERPPSTESRYADCETLGKVVTAQDPPRDVTSNQLPPGQRVTGADSALADLRQVRVAVSSDAVCVAWDFGAPVEQPVSVNFWAYPEDTSKERFSLAGALDPDQPPWVGNGSGGPVDGSVGVRGNSVSVMVAPGPSGEALEGPFSFAAHVGHRVRGTPERPFSYVDELNSPDGVRPAYP